MSSSVETTTIPTGGTASVEDNYATPPLTFTRAALSTAPSTAPGTTPGTAGASAGGTGVSSPTHFGQHATVSSSGGTGGVSTATAVVVVASSKPEPLFVPVQRPRRDSGSVLTRTSMPNTERGHTDRDRGGGGAEMAPIRGGWEGDQKGGGGGESYVGSAEPSVFDRNLAEARATNLLGGSRTFGQPTPPHGVGNGGPARLSSLPFRRGSGTRPGSAGSVASIQSVDSDGFAAPHVSASHVKKTTARYLFVAFIVLVTGLCVGIFFALRSVELAGSRDRFRLLCERQALAVQYQFDLATYAGIAVTTAVTKNLRSPPPGQYPGTIMIGNTTHVLSRPFDRTPTDVDFQEAYTENVLNSAASSVFWLSIVNGPVERADWELYFNHTISDIAGQAHPDGPLVYPPRAVKDWYAPLALTSQAIRSTLLGFDFLTQTDIGPAIVDAMATGTDSSIQVVFGAVIVQPSFNHTALAASLAAIPSVEDTDYDTHRNATIAAYHNAAFGVLLTAIPFVDMFTAITARQSSDVINQLQLTITTDLEKSPHYPGTSSAAYGRTFAQTVPFVGQSDRAIVSDSEPTLGGRTYRVTCTPNAGVISASKQPELISFSTLGGLILLAIGIYYADSKLATRIDHLEMAVDEKRRAIAMLKEARKDAEAANRTKSAFMAYLCHELRTPLFAIMSMLEFMEQERIEPPPAVPSPTATGPAGTSVAVVGGVPGTTTTNTSTAPTPDGGSSVSSGTGTNSSGTSTVVPGSAVSTIGAVLNQAPSPINLNSTAGGTINRMMSTSGPLIVPSPTHGASGGPVTPTDLSVVGTPALVETPMHAAAAQAAQRDILINSIAATDERPPVSPASAGAGVTIPVGAGTASVRPLRASLPSLPPLSGNSLLPPLPQQQQRGGSFSTFSALADSAGVSAGVSGGAGGGETDRITELVSLQPPQPQPHIPGLIVPRASDVSIRSANSPQPNGSNTAHSSASSASSGSNASAASGASGAGGGAQGHTSGGAQPPLTSRSSLDLKRDSFEIIQASTGVMATLLNDVLDMTKIEAGKMRLESVPFDLHSLVHDLIITFQASVFRLSRQQRLERDANSNAAFATAAAAAANAQKTPLTLRCEFSNAGGGDVPRFVMGDAHRLRQVLSNLISNAIKFTPTGFITLKVHHVSARYVPNAIADLRFEVVDTGIGMDEKAQANLFDPFTQAKASTSRIYGGTGLGLTIVRSLVEVMGGAIDVASKPGVGSVFTVHMSFPVVDAAEIVAHQTARGGTFGAAGLATDRSGGRTPLVNAAIMAIAAPGGANLNRHHSLANRLAPPSNVGHTTGVFKLTPPGVPTNFVAGGGPSTPPSPSPPDELPPTLHQGGAGGGRAPPLTLDVPHPVHSVSPALAAAQSIIRDTPNESGTNTPLMTGRPMTGSGMIITGTTPPQYGMIGSTAVVATSLAAPIPRVASHPATAYTAPRGLRVLVVDDNDINRRILSRMLLGDGFAVSTACNGLEAVEQVMSAPANKRFELVLMDLMMPLMDGIEATVKIRAKGVRDLPIIALTANVLLDDRRKCFQVGMNAFLPKPFAHKDLTRAINEVLSPMTGVAAVNSAGSAAASGGLPNQVMSPPTAASGTTATSGGATTTNTASGSTSMHQIPPHQIYHAPSSGGGGGGGGSAVMSPPVFSPPISAGHTRGGGGGWGPTGQADGTVSAAIGPVPVVPTSSGAATTHTTTTTSASAGGGTAGGQHRQLGSLFPASVAVWRGGASTRGGTYTPVDGDAAGLEHPERYPDRSPLTSATATPLVADDLLSPPPPQP